MNFNYFIPFIAFLGLVLGIVLTKIAHEEIRPGRIYLKWFEKFILICLIVGLFFNISLSYFLFIGVVLGYLSAKFLKDYFYLGLACSLSFLFSLEVFFSLNVLVFLYGLPRGSFIKKFSDVYKNFLFFAVPLLILFFSSLSPNILNFLIGICAGGLFNFVMRSFINF